MTTENQQIALAIREHLGGNSFTAIVSACNFVVLRSGLQFQFEPNTPDGADMLTVHRMTDGAYAIEFVKYRRFRSQILTVEIGVQGTDLRRVFEEHTGHRVST